MLVGFILVGDIVGKAGLSGFKFRNGCLSSIGEPVKQIAVVNKPRRKN